MAGPGRPRSGDGRPGRRRRPPRLTAQNQANCSPRVRTMAIPSSSSLLGPLFSSAAMRAVVDDKARLQRMLDVEAALAKAEADAGVIPVKAVEPITQACKAERFDLAK